MRNNSKSILVLFVATASCATTVRYTPAAHTSRATPSGVVVGSIDTQPDTIYVDTKLTPELLAEMHRVAENAGCDELVMDGSTPAPRARYGGHAFTTVSYHASCVVHPEAHTR